MVNPVGKLSAMVVKSRKRGWSYPRAVAVYLARRLTFRSLLFVQWLQKRSGLGAHQIAEMHWNSDLPPCTANYFSRRRKPVFHFDAHDIENIIALVPAEARAEAVRRADEVLRKEFRFRSLPPHRFSREIDWGYSPNGSVSWVWDLNRHGYFADLAAAGFYTGDRRYVKGMIQLWLEWIEKNPVSCKAAWRHPMEVAIRLNNWIWAFHFAVVWGNLSDAATQKIVSLMWMHAHYLYWNLELHWPNNHLIFQAKALLEFSLLFPECDRGRKFLRRSLALFEEGVEEQILGDGVHSELCSMYHRCVSSELLEFLALARRNSFLLGEGIDSKIESTAEFTRAIRRCDGTVPLIGDSAREDVALRFEPGAEPRSWLNYWLWHDELASKYSRCIGNDGPALQVFPEAGYVVCSDTRREDGVHLTIDCGAFSRNPASDHAHCDALSFELHAHGRPILIDAGMYYAVREPELWSRYFRSTSAHNTLAIDGREQSDLWRQSDVKQTADVRLLHACRKNGNADVMASCAPFWGKSTNLCHYRNFRLSWDRGLAICDEIRGDGEHRLEWNFHFAPSLRLEQESHDRITVLDNEDRILLSLAIEYEGLFDVRIYRGSRDPVRGWVSVTGAELLSTETAVISAKTRLPISCRFQLSFQGYTPIG